MKSSDGSSKKGLYKRILIRSALVAVGVFSVTILLPRLIHILLPFVIAFVVATILNPLVTMINRKMGTSRRVIALILDLLAFLAFSGLIGALVYAVGSELVSLANSIQMNWNDIIAKLDGFQEGFSWIYDLLPPQITDVLAGIEDGIVAFLQNISRNLLSTVISATTTMTTKTGNFLINFVIAILAAYFIIADYDGITARMQKHLGKRVRRFLSVLKSSTVTALGGYLKSQLLLASFAFLVMFAALGIYGQPYALLIALFLGFIDLLPIVGTIAVLVPWGVIEWIGGDLRKGLFLLILGVGFFLIRKVVEPKIVGSQTGLHPLAALMSTYVGLQFSGVWGAVLGPVVLMLIISVVKTGIFASTVADVKDVVNHITQAISRPESHEI